MQLPLLIEQIDAHEEEWIDHDGDDDNDVKYKGEGSLVFFIPYSYLKCWQVGLIVPLQEMRRECSCSFPIEGITSLLGLCATFEL